ncbi:unnamed protein product [Mytilus coruscus]|uniref:ALOG domain-containing protein n=1 Tax=Mytilus coruscus TaxID=42192 RepID=A0A6J8DLX0_MYTCO|nr:unnamed protein product [Mytilus coruscus]
MPPATVLKRRHDLKSVNNMGLKLLKKFKDIRILPRTELGRDSGDEDPPPKKKKKNHDLLQRVADLEKSKEDNVKELKDKVRSLALQANPSEPLILLSLDELAKKARRQNDDDAETFDELARQAQKHQGSINVATLTLNVLGGKASDLVGKAMAKFLKEKEVEQKITGNKANHMEKMETTSPLANAYPLLPVCLTISCLRCPLDGSRECFPLVLDVNTQNSGFPHLSTPEWEKKVQFDPHSALQHIRKHPTWVTLDGDKPPNAVHHITFDILNSYIVHDIKKIPIRDPDSFVSVNKFIPRRRKESLQESFLDFLEKLTHKPCLDAVSPHDVKRFLIWKDSNGKTKIHVKSCINLGKKSVTRCLCPIRLASGTVENLISYLTDIFESVGRGRSWNAALNVGNPAASEPVKAYLKVVQEEQARAHIVPKQAKPIFINKVRSIAVYISNRASDIAIVLSQEVKKLDDDSSFVFNHTFGKTLRGGSNKCNTFVLKRCDDKIVCPVSWLESYYTFMKNHGFSLKTGYLFRIITESGRVLENQVSYSIYERFRGYLITLGIFEGETPHSMRA